MGLAEQGTDAASSRFDAVESPLADEQAGETHPARLSIAAVQQAQLLPIDRPDRLSSFLYFYNRAPLSAQRLAAWEHDADLRSLLNPTHAGSIGKLLNAHWRAAPTRNETIWRIWSLRGEAGRRMRYKLYLSPAPAMTAAAIIAAIEVLTDARTPHFKYAANVAALTRPDKFVAYFDRFDQLERTASLLRVRLAGTAAQGVPFSASFDHEGLLSWGLDPLDDQPIAGSGAASRRLQIAIRLAEALIDARRQSEAGEPAWRFALDRLLREGIDTQTWTPLQGFDERRR